eukprot:GHVU01113629.1.p1 GENE.GHVU01113629.1~~GHVU01113629.1.p1  ORF type:complete len:447 (+),score=20.60 GHVU01113629.1:865-2205(+)
MSITCFPGVFRVKLQQHMRAQIKDFIMITCTTALLIISWIVAYYSTRDWMSPKGRLNERCPEIVSEWAVWTDCSAHCGPGERTRSRQTRRCQFVTDTTQVSDCEGDCFAFSLGYYQQPANMPSDEHLNLLESCHSLLHHILSGLSSPEGRPGFAMCAADSSAAPNYRQSYRFWLNSTHKSSSMTDLVTTFVHDAFSGSSVIRTMLSDSGCVRSDDFSLEVYKMNQTAGSECQPLDVGDRVATISHPHRICANNHICEAASLRPYKPIFGQACQNNLTTPAEFDNAPKTQFKCDRRMDCRCFYGVWNHGTTKQQWYTGGGCATELVPQQDSVAFVPVKGSVYFKTYPGMTCSESNSYVPMEYLDVHPAPPMFPDDGNCVTRCRELWGCTCVFLHRDRDPPECHLYFETIGYPLPAFGNGTSNGTAVVIASDDETTETCESEEGKSWP